MIYKNLKNILSFLKPVPIKFLEGFLSWSEAENKIDKGYADERIIQNCKNAVTKVLNGEACYERDGVVFQDKSFNDLFLASLILMKKNYFRINTFNISDYDFNIFKVLNATREND